MDRYKRILGDVYIGKRWINVELVSEGMAWHYKYYSKDKTMAAAEVKAKAAKLGIWSLPVTFFLPVPSATLASAAGTTRDLFSVSLLWDHLKKPKNTVWWRLISLA